MRHEASGALLTVGWMVVAAYLAAVLIVAASGLTLGAVLRIFRRGQEVEHA